MDRAMFRIIIIVIIIIVVVVVVVVVVLSKRGDACEIKKFNHIL